MILTRLQQEDCRNGWLLDGFPRNLSQAKALKEALDNAHMKLDYVIEIVLDREIAKQRIMGRRLCAVDNNHPNNIYIDAIKPAEKDGKLVCRVCGSDRLTTRPDDQDAAAIDRRHSIYYDAETGTLAAVNYFKKHISVVEIDGTPGVREVATALLAKLQ
jgi:adenylate kinase